MTIKNSWYKVYHKGKTITKVEFGENSRYPEYRGIVSRDQIFLAVNAIDELDAFVIATKYLKERTND